MITADELRAKIIEQFRLVHENTSGESKEVYRALHAPAVKKELVQSQKWIQANFSKYAKYFADGTDINVGKIQPSLVEVSYQKEADLFRLARLTWSLPFTKGYGRRLRFLVMDNSNDKIIGIIGLQSPPLDFTMRDKLFTYPLGRKVELINQTMDLYTLGALPPYNRLLGGKLVALAAASDEVRQSYNHKYGKCITQIEKRVLPSVLVALTTTSAFGRSSIYNRLTYHDRPIAFSLGYTGGYGSFHLSPVYTLVREYLEQNGVSTRGGFGVGPRIVWQTYERAFSLLGLSGELLKHGIRREAFLFPLVSNLKEYMNGQTESPIQYRQSFHEMAEWWRNRWLFSRAQRIDGWHTWSKDRIKEMLILESSGGGCKDEH